MAYTPTQWSRGDKVTSAKLNKIENGIVSKVDKVTGKDLSTNDYTNADKKKVDDISISSPTNGQALVYNSSTQKWENKTISGGGSGSDGYSPTITVTNITGGHRVSITDVNGTKRFDVMDGTNGTNGTNGSDGFSPTITVTNITNGHRVNITDATGTNTFDVMNGSGSGGGSSINVDNTLTISGDAADSKTVGDTFSLLTQGFNQKLQVFNSSRDGLVPKSGGDDLDYTYYGCTANSVTITKVGSNVLISNIQTSTNYIWCGVGLGITRAIVTAGQTELILLAVDLTNNRMLLLRPSASAIIIANIGGDTAEIATVVENVTVPSTNYVIEVTETGVRISVNGNGTDYAVPNMGNYTGDLGFCWLLGRETGSASLRYTLLTDESASNRFLRSDGLWISPDTSGEQWNGKTWYAYGTSITNIASEGKYPTYLAQMSGMTLVNKGISGGGIGNLGGHSQGQVYDAICNITDGKLDADLITLETGANDIATDVTLGTVYDTGQSTLAGCLNDCLQYLQANTDAQIVVLPSPVTTTQNPNSATKAYEWFKMIREICDINRVHFINSNNNMGWGKLSSNKGSTYIVDHGHHTDLGGYIFAQNIWYQLRNIPTFNIEDTPTDTWTELFDGNLTVEAYQNSYRLSVIDNYTDTMSVGDTYRVTFKGTQYVCEATADENTGLIYIGNRRWSGGDTSSANEPFIAYVNNGQLRILSGETAGSTISFKIEKYTL